MKSKKVIILSLIIGVIVIVTGISVTYAYWASTHVSNSNVVRSGCLNIEYKDITDAINARRVGPGFDASNKYIFSITNTCSNDVNYQVNLESLEGTTIDLSSIKLAVVGYNTHDYRINDKDDWDNYIYNENDADNDLFIDNDYLLSDLEEMSPTLSNAISSYLINRKLIKANDTHLYEIFSWVDGSIEDNQEEEREWYSKVTVTSVPAKQVKVTLDPNGGELDNRILYFTEGDTYGNLPVPEKEDALFVGWYSYDDETISVTNNSLLINNSDHKLKAKYMPLSGTSILKPYAFHNFSNNSGDYIKYFAPYSGYVSEDIINNAVNISESGVDAYAWVEDETLYYWSSAEKIYMQRDMFNGPESGASSYFVFETMDFSRIDTSRVTDMSGMFQSLSNLISLDLSNFDTSNVTSMNFMFSNCYNLSDLNISGFNTSNVTSMYNMFWQCYSLTSLDLSNFNTSKVTSMSEMFESCTGLSSLNLTGWNTSSVTEMYGMFWGCEGLQTLDLTSFNTSNVTVMDKMFAGCSSLKSLNISNFNTHNVTSMISMFYECENLQTLDLTNFDTSSIINTENIKYIFGDCWDLTNITINCDNCSVLINYINSNYNSISITCL